MAMVASPPSSAGLSLRLAFVLVFPSFCADVRPSTGCARPNPDRPAVGVIKYNMTVLDFEPVFRSYEVQRYTSSSVPAPLLFSFHGQSGNGDGQRTGHFFSDFVGSEGLIGIFPDGMDDADALNDQGTTWNTGSAGSAGNSTCLPDGVGDQGGCYNSCRKLGLCGRCNWNTCYDDVLFVKLILQTISSLYCVDLNRVYAHGESNGAMFVQHLVRELPGTFAAVAPWFGTPLISFLNGNNSQLIVHLETLRGTGYLALHGRQDVTIPPMGGVTSDGWIYEPERQATGVWAAVNGCGMDREPMMTPWDGRGKAFGCMEHPHCTSGAQVISCMYDGVHGDWPQGKDGDNITMWFFLQFSRGAEQGAMASVQV
eukprot:NODE_9310_length_1433_cov_2.707504.p1 GENE.NODE_9310_length_1433_cov_2.707504~~NODE_9310_length_1433_cov_2.707504.p1  ORF type:complete len:395 (+),score=56.72 NODE_9310_length_1433_cov_2.707504:79-1185(+)